MKFTYETVLLKIRVLITEQSTCWTEDSTQERVVITEESTRHIGTNPQGTDHPPLSSAL